MAAPIPRPLLLALLLCACQDGGGAPMGPDMDTWAEPPPGACLPALRPAPYGGTAMCPAPLPDTPDFLDDVLRAGGMTRCDLTLPRERMERFLGGLAHDRFRLPYYDAVHDAPMRVPAFARETISWLD